MTSQILEENQKILSGNSLCDFSLVFNSYPVNILRQNN